jgi:hypothetical protein
MPHKMLGKSIHLILSNQAKMFLCLPISPYFYISKIFLSPRIAIAEFASTGFFDSSILDFVECFVKVKGRVNFTVVGVVAMSLGH